MEAEFEAVSGEEQEQGDGDVTQVRECEAVVEAAVEDDDQYDQHPAEGHGVLLREGVVPEDPPLCTFHGPGMGDTRISYVRGEEGPREGDVAILLEDYNMIPSGS